ncbi:LegC family aminotransferase [Syntrophomonas wolfei]|uniref:LegC family aminotransferase n=1 Tax=Syntrophomonas wolfei TaxID=863 RepID=UPI0007737F0B|nr:LegC family aminotransferase [Syntrophomonas wolfei]
MNGAVKEFVHSIINTLESVLPSKEYIPLHEPEFSGREWEYVKDCLDSGWVSSVGAYVDRFEQMLCDYTGSPYAVAAVNGTAALHICLLLAGVKAGDEVLVPAATFIATANTVTYCNAIPHFVDVEERTLGLDPHKLNDYLKEISEFRRGICYNRLTGRPIRAVVPMHTFGHPVDLDPLQELCERYHLVMVEDAAESLGSLYKGQHTGTRGLVSSLSFNGNKTITTGGGGAILTNSKSIAKVAKHMTTQAKTPHRWEFNHDLIGYNYRMPNINAALGCAQLEQLPGFIEKKRNLARCYQVAFQDIPGIRFFTEPDFARSNYWLNVLILDEEFARERDNLLESTNNAGIMTRPLWTLMHKLSMYHDCPRMDLSVAEDLESRVINIPSSAYLGK